MQSLGYTAATTANSGDLALASHYRVSFNPVVDTRHQSLQQNHHQHPQGLLCVLPHPMDSNPNMQLTLDSRMDTEQTLGQQNTDDQGRPTEVRQINIDHQLTLSNHSSTSQALTFGFLAYVSLSYQYAHTWDGFIDALQGLLLANASMLNVA